MGPLIEGFNSRALTKLREAERYLSETRYGESVSASMESMELSAKTVFLALAGSYPKRHDFRDEEFEGLLDKVPDALRYLDFPRLFFQYKFWQQFYTTAKYGDERLNVSPNQLLGRLETELALEHSGRWNSARLALLDAIPQAAA